VNQLINIDTTGLDALESLHKFLEKRGCFLILCGLNHQPLSLIERAGFLQHLGSGQCIAELPQALQRARDLLHSSPKQAFEAGVNT
jgi:SulP family sulfate permease